MLEEIETCEENDAPQLYVSYRGNPDTGEIRVVGYAYGAPWVAQALYMDDMRFDTPEEAKAFWEKNYGGSEFS